MTTRLDQVKRLAELDYTNAEIAARLGIGSTRTVIRMKRKAGIPPRHNNALPDGVREEIRRRSEEDGWPPEEIVDTLGVSPEAAHKWSIRGPGKEWSETASRLALKHRALWNELRDKR